jgi:hypothetical protein
MKPSIKPIFFLALFLALASFLAAQGFYYFPYYGKNRVLYGKFSWRSYQTEHFHIYFYAEDIQSLKNVAELAESAYQRISQLLKHQVSEPIPLIYYTTYTDFEQTNIFPISEGVLGVSEPALYRIGVHGDMSLDELQDLIEHELSHIFQFDLLWGSPGGALYAVSAPPDWVFEGLSEYSTHKWSSWSSLIVRDAILNDRIPELTEGGDLFARYPLPRDPAYDFGHAIYEFIETKFGVNGVREFWQTMKNSPIIGKREPLKKAFNIKPKEFNQEFKKYLRNQVKGFLLREMPEDYSIPLGPEFPSNPYYFDLSHALSPSGDIVAALTFNIKDAKADIVFISTKDGSVIKNITRGYTLKYEYIKYEIDPSKGKNIAWSSDGDRIAFFARDGEKYSLFIISALDGSTIKKVKISLDQPYSPCFYPSGDELLFVAFQRGVHDIYKIDLSTAKIANLTGDDLYEKAPVISPDGKSVAYTIRINSYDKLFISPLDNLKKKTQLTFDKGNTITPQFSPDSKVLFFSGDMRDAYNIYSLNLETGELKRYTDVRTGNFFPSPVPNSPKTVIFSSFNKGAFQIFKSDPEGVTETTIKFAEITPAEKFERFEPAITLEVNKDKIVPNKGIGKLYLVSRPPIQAVVSTDGSIYGGSALSFSDLLGDHNLYIMAYQVRSFRSYSAAYLNQKRRLQFAASAYQYTEFYYPPYAYYDPALYNWLTYQDAIASRKITGANFSAYYPFNRYYRAEAGVYFSRYEEEFVGNTVYDYYERLYNNRKSYSYFWNGNLLSAAFSLVGETTHFKYYGPASGNTFRLSLSQSAPVTKSFFRNTTVEVDLRQYVYLGFDSLLAFRWNGFASRGRDPFFSYFGGNNQVRSAGYYNIIGNEGWYLNAELRFPLISGAATIIGQIGPVRGTFFFDVARTKVKGYPAKFFYYYVDASGIRLVSYEAIGSFGYGLEFFFLGLPIHLEFVKRINFPSIASPFNLETEGSFKTQFWIGWDF